MPFIELRSLLAYPVTIELTSEPSRDKFLLATSREIKSMQHCTRVDMFKRLFSSAEISMPRSRMMPSIRPAA